MLQKKGGKKVVNLLTWNFDVCVVFFFFALKWILSRARLDIYPSIACGRVERV